MKPLKLALVGFGLHGPTFPYYVNGVDGLDPIGTIVALVDTHEGNRQRGAHALTLPDSACFKTLPKLLDSNLQIDGVLVATPADVREPVNQAIQAGKHVFCENPLAAREQTALGIYLHASNCPEVVVTINEQWRFLPTIRAIKDLLPTHIGPLRCITIGGKGRPASTEIMRIGSHLLSVALNAFDLTVTGEGTALRSEDEADVVAILQTHQDVPIVGKFISGDKVDVGRCSILLEGSKGCAYAIGGLLERLWVREVPYDSVAYPTQCPFEGWELHPSSADVPVINTDESNAWAMQNPKMNPMFWLIREWAKAIAGETDNPSPPDDYVNVVTAMKVLLQQL